ncbi:MAG: NAD(P)H-dependent glycerol-3-phosphate dehydrogenase [Candidatus Omnitrophota bacterium]
MTHRYRISVLGDGGWGTALAVINARRGNEVLLWSAFADYAKLLRETRENKKFLPGISIEPSIVITSDLKEALDFADIIVLAIPTRYLRNVVYWIKEQHITNKVFVSVAKGIENRTLLRPSQIVRSILGEGTRLGILSGPSHAEEVARNIPTLVVIASRDKSVAQFIQAALCDTFFRIYVQTDEVGVELGGALKNVIAVAAGVSDGLGYGDNTKSGLVSRGLLEMMRLTVRSGGNPNTVFGLSGLGDLATTCFSPHGRNLKVGREIGLGKKVREILASMEMVAEGVDTAKSVHEMTARMNLELPIMNEVYRMVFEDKDPRQAVTDLLNRAVYDEWKQY